MISPTYIKLEETGSTNSHLASIAATCEHGTVVSTNAQTAGRGQRGNSWEALPGKNLTFSILLRPRHINARAQFAVSEIVSIAIVNVLRRYLSTPEVAIKWPNDIYVGDKKICGILIENSLIGLNIGHSIAGIGININQERFYSDAPNPVSLINLTGQAYDLDNLLDEFCREILSLFNQYDTIDYSVREKLHDVYRSMLWRRKGFHPYATPDGKRFDASIEDVSHSGLLTLCDAEGRLCSFAFKEISAVI